MAGAVRAASRVDGDGIEQGWSDSRPVTCGEGQGAIPGPVNTKVWPGICFAG